MKVSELMQGRTPSADYELSLIHISDPDTEVCVNFEDGFIVDKDSQRERDRQDVLDGIMLKYEYRMKWYGETEEEAKAVLAAASSDENDLMFGGD